MDILAKEQSDLLKLLVGGDDDKINFSSLTPEQQEDFRHLACLGFITVYDSIRGDRLPDGSLEGVPCIWATTPRARQYLANEHLALQHEEYYHQEVDHLKSLAQHAQAEAESARHEARIAKILTVISVLIAFLSLLLDFFQ